MIYALQRIQTERGAELKKLGIDLRPETSVILYRDTAYQFKTFTSDRDLIKRIERCIKDAKERKIAAQAANQTNLLEGL